MLLFVWKNELSANLFVDVYFFLYLCAQIAEICAFGTLNK